MLSLCDTLTDILEVSLALIYERLHFKMYVFVNAIQFSAESSICPNEVSLSKSLDPYRLYASNLYLTLTSE